MRPRRALLLVLFAALPAAGEGEVRLLTDDAIPRYLMRAEDQAKAGEWDKMVGLLQLVVDGDPGVFQQLDPESLNAAVHTTDGVLYRSAREVCLRRLADMPPEGLRAYRTRFDAEARELYERAREADEVEERLRRLDEVHDRFLVSSVGDDALEEAARLQMALGRTYEALALLRRLVDLYPDDTDRDLALALTRAAWCAARIGARDTRDRLLERLAREHPRARPLVEGEPVPVGGLAAHPQFAVGGATAVRREGDWPMPGGDATRARTGRDLPDDLPVRPYWEHRLAERDARWLDRLGRWERLWPDRSEVRGDEVRPAPEGRLPAPRAIAVDGVVYYKDYSRLLARRAGSGSLLLMRTDLQGGDSELRGARPGLRADTEELKRVRELYWYLDYGTNVPLSDGVRVFGTHALEPPRHLAPGGSNRRPLPPVNGLEAWSIERADPVWAWMLRSPLADLPWDSATQREWETDFRTHDHVYFRGPGTVADGLLYTVVSDRQRDGMVSLWCFETATGRVRYRTRLHEHDEVPGELPCDSLVAVAGGVAYVLTQAGVVAAVDALPPGRVRWIRRYPRAWQAGIGGRASATAVLTSFDLNEPVVTGGKVIVAPADGRELLAIDAESGVVAWSMPAGRIGPRAVLLGVSQGVLVFADDEDRLCGIDAGTGEALWGRPAGTKVRLERWACGRGWVGRTTVHVPSRHSPPGDDCLVERFDVRTGERREPLRLLAPTLGNLLFVEGRLIAIDNETIRCFTSRERETAYLDRRLEREGPRPGLYLERALVALRDPAGPDREAARADFRRALEAAPPGSRAPDLVLPEGIENLLALARERNDLAALDEAAELEARLWEGTGLAREHPLAAQIAMVRVEVLAALGRADDALAALEDWTATHHRLEVRRPGPRIVAVPQAARELYAELRTASPGFAEAFTARVRAAIAEARAAADVAGLRALPRRFAQLPPSHEALFAAAELQAAAGEEEAAELTLRGVLDGDPARVVVAETYLRLARLQLAHGLPAEAAASFRAALEALDDAGRARLGPLLAEVRDGLPAAASGPRPVRLELPLAPGPLPGPQAGTPVPVGGPAAERTLWATAEGWTARDASGAVLWSVPAPLGGLAPPGPAAEPSTAPVAARIAGRRLAHAVDGDLVLADVRGILRVDAATGAVAWSWPPAAARDEELRRAQDAVAAVARDLEALLDDPLRPRGTTLPLHVPAGDRIVRVQSGVGVLLIDARTGRVVATRPVAGGHPVGPPAITGGSVVVGWNDPARVEVLGLEDLRVLARVERPGARLVAPPVLGPWGRLFLAEGDAETGADGRLLAFDPAAGGDAGPLWTHPAISNRAFVLAATGERVVFHDGGSGNANLHLLDAATGRGPSLEAPDMLRDVTVLPDGGRLFVASWTAGDRGVGARLWRLDGGAGPVLAYEGLPLALAWARPLLTERYLAIAASGPDGTAVMLFEREATGRSRGPQTVFRGAAGLADRLVLPPGPAPRYHAAPGLAADGAGLALGHPFGAHRLRASTTR